MLNAKQVLIVVVVALFIIGVSMEANAGEPEGGSQVGYNITCGTLALLLEDEPKATYYSNLVPVETTDEVLRSWIVKTISDVQKYAEMQGLTAKVVAGYGFTNYGCNRPFI